MATPREIGIGARLFVFLVYLGLGLSFVVTTAVLAHVIEHAHASGHGAEAEQSSAKRTTKRIS